MTALINPGINPGMNQIHLKNIMKPTLDASGLDNQFYTSRDYFTAERDKVFSTGWTALTFASQLPTPGKAKPMEFMGLPLVIINDKNTIRVFHNVCRHRGHKLVLEEADIGRAISCPYHCWTYGADGTLLATPHIGGVNQHETEGFDKSKYGLVPIAHGIFMNMVFINIDNKAEPLEQYMKPIMDRWHEFLGDDGFSVTSKGIDNADWNVTAHCNWKLAIENYCEAYHLPFIHPNLNSYSPLDVHYNIIVGENFSGQGTNNYAPTATEIDGKTTYLPRFKNWNPEKPTTGEYLSLYPNVLCGIQNDQVFAIILTPISESETLEQMETFYIGEGATNPKLAPCRRDASGNWQQVFGEDISPIESMQAGRQSSGFDGGHFSPVLDVSTHHFHRWVAAKFM